MAALAHLTSRDGGNAKGLSGTILALCFAAPAHPCAMEEMRKDCRSNPRPAVVRKWAERSRFPGYPRRIATAILLESPKIWPRSPTPSLRAPMRYRLLEQAALKRNARCPLQIRLPEMRFDARPRNTLRRRRWTNSGFDSPAALEYAAAVPGAMNPARFAGVPGSRDRTGSHPPSGSARPSSSGWRVSTRRTIAGDQRRK